MLLAEKTKQQKLIENKAKKSNAFGLGLTSLIAACSSAVDDKGNNIGNKAGPVGTIPTANLKAEEVTAETAVDSDIVTTTIDSGRAVYDARVTVKAGKFGVGGADLVLQFANGKHLNNPYATINKLGGDKDILIVASSQFGDSALKGDGTEVSAGYASGAVYIFWDIASINASETDTAQIIANTLAAKHLKVAGTTENVILYYMPKFYKSLGSDKGQVDMVFGSSTKIAKDLNNQSSNNINIVWDVTKYSDAEATGETELTLGNSNGILQVKNTVDYIESYELIKINNNEDYDVLIKSTAELQRGSQNPIKDTYILWDAASYYDATKNVSIELTAASATNGLLKITGLIENIMTSGLAEDGYTDINKGGINDLAFKYGDNIFILFGEKIAIRDDEGKAFSYEVDLATINIFYDNDIEKAGFFSYDFDGNGGNSAIEKVGYRFAASARAAADDSALDTLAKVETAYTDANPPVTEGELSSAAYWDIA